MSFFQFTGNISPEEYKKTLENVASLQEQYQDRVDTSAGINKKTKTGIRRKGHFGEQFKKNKDDNPELTDESKSYNEIRNKLITLPILDKISYIINDHPELLATQDEDDTLFPIYPEDAIYQLGSEGLSVIFDTNRSMRVTENNGPGVEFPPPQVTGAPPNEFYVYDNFGDRENDYINPSVSYNNVFTNLLLFDLRVLDHFDLLQGAELLDLEVYYSLIDVANGNTGNVPQTEKMQKVEELLSTPPKKITVKEKQAKPQPLPRKPSEIEQLRKQPVQKTFKRTVGKGIDDNLGPMAEEDLQGSQVAMTQEEDEFNDPGSNRGTGVKPKRPRTSRGLAPNSSYIIQGSKFGNLDVDVPLLFNKLHLRAKKGGELIVDEPVDRDTLDLLTHRIKPGKLYSKKAEKMLTKMISNSNYELHPNSQKLKIAQNRISRKREKKYAKKKGESYDEPDLSRLITLTSEIAAGNYPNSELLTEIRNISNGLYKTGKIDSTLYRELKNKYGI